MPILRNPQRGDAPAPVDDAGGDASSVRDVSGEYRVIAPRRETTKMWAQRPATPATLPAMNAVRHARPGAAPERRASSAHVAGGSRAHVVGASSAHVAAASRAHVAGVSSASSPRRTGTLKMAAVRPFEDATPPPSGRMLDDLDFLASEHPPVALELGALPAGHGARETMAGGKLPQSVRFTPRPMEAVQAPSSTRTAELRDARPALIPPSSGRAQVSSLELEALATPPTELATSVSSLAIGPLPAVDPRPGIVAFAGFGIVPDAVGELPTYALRVLARRRILRDGLKVARARRPQDVELYEAALACADEDAVAKGLGLAVAVLVLGVAVVAAAIAVVL